MDRDDASARLDSYTADRPGSTFSSGRRDALHYAPANPECTRQPILDENHRVHGYQLDFDRGANSVDSRGGVQAVRTVLDDPVIFPDRPLHRWIACVGDSQRRVAD
jgi:hypothetical protein